MTQTPLLVPGVYGTEAEPRTGPFGLSWGQTRRPEQGIVGKGLAWYTQAGELLGQGDLSVSDVRRICREIPEGEGFCVYEGDRGAFLCISFELHTAADAAAGEVFANAGMACEEWTRSEIENCTFYFQWYFGRE